MPWHNADTHLHIDTMQTHTYTWHNADTHWPSSVVSSSLAPSEIRIHTYFDTHPHLHTNPSQTYSPTHTCFRRTFLCIFSSSSGCIKRSASEGAMTAGRGVSAPTIRGTARANCTRLPVKTILKLPVEIILNYMLKQCLNYMLKQC